MVTNYYNWSWFDGESDCSPSEPDKHWIAITDAHNDSEVCILVLRNPKKFAHLVPELEDRAVQIVSALEQQLHDAGG